MKSPGKVFIIIILSCVLYLVLGMVNPDSVFACAWYAGNDGNTNTNKGGGKGSAAGKCSTSDGDPVAVTSGCYYETITDLFVSSPGIPVEIGRSFYNLDLRSSSIGWGWRFSLDIMPPLALNPEFKKYQILHF